MTCIIYGKNILSLCYQLLNQHKNNTISNIQNSTYFLKHSALVYSFPSSFPLFSFLFTSHLPAILFLSSREHIQLHAQIFWHMQTSQGSLIYKLKWRACTSSMESWNFWLEVSEKTNDSGASFQCADYLFKKSGGQVGQKPTINIAT